VGKNMKSDKEEEKSQLELQEEIKQLKKRIKYLERERDILLALHRRDYE
jgi:transposase-like protein